MDVEKLMNKKEEYKKQRDQLIDQQNKTLLLMEGFNLSVSNQQKQINTLSEEMSKVDVEINKLDASEIEKEKEEKEKLQQQKKDENDKESKEKGVPGGINMLSKIISSTQGASTNVTNTIKKAVSIIPTPAVKIGLAVAKKTPYGRAASIGFNFANKLRNPSDENEEMEETERKKPKQRSFRRRGRRGGTRKKRSKRNRSIN